MIQRPLRLAAYRAFAMKADNKFITSWELSEQTGINSSEIRRDLSVLGAGGRRGVGYSASELTALLTDEIDGQSEELAAQARHHLHLMQRIIRSLEA